jgi:hypothetical protein
VTATVVVPIVMLQLFGGGAVCAEPTDGTDSTMPARAAAIMNEPSVLTLMFVSFRTTA